MNKEEFIKLKKLMGGGNIRIIMNPDTYEAIKNYKSILDGFDYSEINLSKKWSKFHALEINRIFSKIRRFTNEPNHCVWKCIYDVFEYIEGVGEDTFLNGRWGYDFIINQLEEIGILDLTFGSDNIRISDDGILLYVFLKDFGFANPEVDFISLSSCCNLEVQPFWAIDNTFTQNDDRSYLAWKNMYEFKLNKGGNEEKTEL